MSVQTEVERIKTAMRKAAQEVIGLKLDIVTDDTVKWMELFQLYLLTPTSYRIHIGSVMFDEDSGKVIDHMRTSSPPLRAIIEALPKEDVF